MVQLSPIERQELITILKKRLDVNQHKVLLFGSRARGEARRFSDIDLAVVAQNRLERAIYHQLIDDFEESRLPYTIDLVDLQLAGEPLRSRILREGVELEL